MEIFDQINANHENKAMQLKFNERINIDAITRRFKEAFGVPLTWHLLPNTELVAFSIGEGYPLDPHEKTWLSERYKPNAKCAGTDAEAQDGKHEQ